MTPTPSTPRQTPISRHIDASRAGAATPKPKRRPAGGSRDRRKADQGSNPADDRPPQLLRHSVALQFRMAIHEAGHAVTRLYLSLGVIEKITLDGAEGGGVTWRIDALDDQTEELLTAAIVIALAGRAAEEEILASTAGLSGGSDFSDLAVATEIAFEMEATLGLGQKWPLLYRPTTDRAILFALDPDLASRVNARLETAYGAARRIVARQRDAIEHLAALLLKDRTLEGDALDRILAEIAERTRE